MNVQTLIVLVMGFSVNCDQNYKYSGESRYHILFLMPFGLHSHRHTLFPIAEALALRGHEVTFLTGLDPLPTNSSLHQIKHDVTFPINHRNYFDRRKNPISVFEGFAELLPNFAKHFYASPIVKPLYKDRDKFDVIVIDSFFNEFAYLFLIGKPFILSNAIGINPTISSIMGNVLNPAFVPGMTASFQMPQSVWQRLVNIYEHTYFPFFWRYIYVVPAVQKEISLQFPDLPPLLEIERNASLTFSQSHFSLDLSIPLLPSQVEIGGHICTTPKALPKVYEDFIRNSKSGVIYFSLGGVSKGQDIPFEYRKMLFEAFARLPQNVIMKYEDKLSSVPGNVILGNWLPQQDILGHPNVLLFITHAGRLSYIEGICHSKPMLAIPIIGDQLKNADAIEKKSYGKKLVWEELTVDKIVTNIQEIITDHKYQESTKEAAKQMKDQPENPLERAIWWTEYVARNKGAPSLKSPAARLSWIEYFNLDLIIAFHLLLFSLFYVTKKFVKCLQHNFRSQGKENQKNKGKKKRE